MEHAYHGGGCCGRRHIYGMAGVTSTASIQAFMRRHDLIDDDLNKITEIVLNENQNSREELRQAVLGAGFVLVAVWDNDSGSRCYMYLHANDWTAFPNGAAVPIAPPPPPPPAPRPPRDPAVIVHSTFHNVFRHHGRSDAGWSTREQAAAAAPRAASIDRRDIYASGVIRWVTGV